MGLSIWFSSWVSDGQASLYMDLSVKSVNSLFTARQQIYLQVIHGLLQWRPQSVLDKVQHVELLAMKNALQQQVGNGSSEDGLLSFDDKKVALYLRCARERQRDPAY